jgi:hypothetical protein
VERFGGKLVCDGQTVVDSIVGVIYHRHDEGLIGWDGNFTLTPSASVTSDFRIGESYQLVLDDGRSGTIIVKSPVGTSDSLFHKFQGSLAPP